MSPRMNLTRSAKLASERTSFEKNDNATLTGLDADHAVCGLAVVSALVKAMALRAVEDDDAQAGVQILAPFAHRQIWAEGGELMSGGDMQLWLRHLGARQHSGRHRARGRQQILPCQKLSYPLSRRWVSLRWSCSCGCPLIVPPISDIAGEFVTPHQACPSHAQPVENGFGQIADVDAEPLRLATVFNDKLQQDEAFSRIAVPRAGIEMDAASGQARCTRSC